VVILFRFSTLLQACRNKRDIKKKTKLKVFYFLIFKPEPIIRSYSTDPMVNISYL